MQPTGAGHSILIGDIGGTNARFALAVSGATGYAEERILQRSDFATAYDAIDFYLKQAGGPTPSAICLAVAGPVVDGSVMFTNSPWTLSAAELSDRFKMPRVRLLNDFEAIAYALPQVGSADCASIGPFDGRYPGEEDFTVAVIGPGTGLGSEGLKKTGSQLALIDSEISHCGFAPESERQLEVLAELRNRHERVCNETIVSGPGIENLYAVLSILNGRGEVSATAKQVFAAGIGGKDPAATEAVSLFFEIFGQIAGDFALALGASDGIYVAGGVAQRYHEQLHGSNFRRAFESKGQHRYLLQKIPTRLLTHPQPGLLGAAYCGGLL
jgi:glucokinase